MVVIGEIATQKSLEMKLVENNMVIQTLPSNVANDTRNIGILPRAPRCDGTVLQSQISDPFSEVRTKNGIAIT